MSVSLLHYNTFGIDATCDALVRYSTVEELQSQLSSIRSQRWLHIGAGSNLLFLNPHYSGTIVFSQIQGVEVIDQDEHTALLRVGAGEDWDEFVARTLDMGLYGLENLSLIPGQVGASAVQNVGAYGVEVGDLIERVEAVEVSSGQLRTFTHAECNYAYRSSAFKHELRNQFVITHVHYRLRKSFSPVLTHAAVVRLLESEGLDPQRATAQQVRAAVVSVRKSKLPDPKEVGSAGSFFMNPVVPPDHDEDPLAQHPQMPHCPTSGGTKIPAGWLIEQCSWKGRTLGRAGVHPLQALVLINADHATGRDIQTLAEAIQHDVAARFGIQLHPEVLYIE